MKVVTRSIAIALAISSCCWSYARGLPRLQHRNKRIKVPGFWHGVDKSSVVAEAVESGNIGLKELEKILSFWEEHYNLTVPAWTRHYSIVSDLIRAYGCRVGCEVGVAFGTQSEHIILNTDVKRLYSIDPYIPFARILDFIPNDPIQSQQWMDVHAQVTMARLSPYKDRCELIRKKSVDAARDFLDDSLDFVYIDGEHTYEAVRGDLNAWYPKIRLGGVIIGDDYTERFAGLRRATDEFVLQRGLQLDLRSGGKYVIVKV